MVLKVYDPMKGKLVVAGEYLKTKRLFRKKVKAHNIYRANDGVGISIETLVELHSLGCLIIELDIEGRGVYQSHPDIWDWEFNKSVEVHNHGHGIQHFLPIRCMTKKI